MIHVLGEINGDAPIGGKARQLDQLIKAGVPVPPGMVIDAESWQMNTWKDELDQAFVRLPAPLYVVRSSAEREDGKTISFAGMFRSQLRVPKQHLSRAIEEVCAHASQLVSLDTFAVIIQPWIEGGASGVSFTRHPTHDYGLCMVTDAVKGAAEKVVSGTASVQRAFCWGKDHLIPTPFVLTIEQLQNLCTNLQIIEQALGCPVDVEWTLQQGHLFFLQARPMTHLPRPNAIDRAEAAVMRRYASDYQLLLIKNELDETLPYPSRASFDLLGYLFRPKGAYQRAAEALGMTYHPDNVAGYFVNLLGHLYINPKSPPFSLPRGIFRSLEASWQLQKELRRFPLELYQTPVRLPPGEKSMEDILSALEQDLGFLYAKTSILARIAFTHPKTAGITYDEIWRLRQAWLMARSKQISTQDLELSFSPSERPRQTWTPPHTVKDLYAIMREDIKDELRPWFLALHQAIIKTHDGDEYAFDHPLTSHASSDLAISDNMWHDLRRTASQQTIASPFIWKHLWNIRFSGVSEGIEKNGVGVSEGIGEGTSIHPTSPTDARINRAMIVLEALTPEWFPLLECGPAGIITEKGSLMSHGAIQCRERRIPAIFGFQGARQRCPEHARIRLDGKRGEVTLLE